MRKLIILTILLVAGCNQVSGADDITFSTETNTDSGTETDTQEDWEDTDSSETNTDTETETDTQENWEDTESSPP